MTYEFERQHRLPFNEFLEHCTGDMSDEDTRTTVKTASQINDPQTGKVEFSDPQYLRIEPKHNETPNLDRLLQKLSKVSNGDFDRCDCQSCMLLKMWRREDPDYRRRTEEAERIRQEQVNAQKLERDIE